MSRSPTTITASPCGTGTGEAAVSLLMDRSDSSGSTCAMSHALRRRLAAGCDRPCISGVSHSDGAKITAPTLKEHREGTRERLLDAWVALTTEHGYETVTLADVAAQAGLARSALYRYFPDKDAVLFAATDREMVRVLADLDQAFSGTTSSVERLRIYIELQFTDFATRPPPPGRELAAILAPDVYERFLRHIEPIERIVEDLIAEGVASGEFRDVDPAATALLVIGCIGAERLPLGTGAHRSRDAVRRVTDFIAHALGAPPTPRPPPKRRSTKRKPA